MTDQTGDAPNLRAEELLLLRLNGRLTEGEAAELADLLAQNPDFAQEEAFLQAMKNELAARDPGTSPGEFGLARLKRAVEDEVRAPAVAPAEDRGSSVVSLSSPGARTWRYAAIAATVLLAVQTATVFTNPEGVLRLAGGSVERHAGPAFIVAFVPDASEADIRGLLIGLDLNIVSGPSALGLYTVVAAEGAAVAEILDALNAAPVVESAERE